MQPVKYDPSIFDAPNLAAAKSIILTPEGGSTAERWLYETPWIIDRLLEHKQIGSDDIVLDYGCGVGRLAKELIARTGCRVVGVDISAKMRGLAATYVDSPRFFSCAPGTLDWLGLETFDAVLAVWVLQHSVNPVGDLRQIREYAFRAPVLIVNNYGRAVPTNDGWKDDGQDVEALVLTRFPTYHKKAGGQLPNDIAPPAVVEGAWWGIFE